MWGWIITAIIAFIAIFIIVKSRRKQESKSMFQRLSDCCRRLKSGYKI
ncbi:MAG: hypothetical protein AABY22_15185 [Nanoarchaeota archaeon]